jgi:membrane protease YdiL (CAAX protease family)
MNAPSAEVARRRDLVAVAVALVLPSLVTWVYFVWLKSSTPAIQQSAYSVGKAIQFLLPVVWVFVVERRRWEWQRPSTLGLSASIGFGVAVVTAMMALYHLYLKPAGLFGAPGEAVRDKVAGFGVDTPLRYAAMGLFYSIGHSFLEEYYWRWFVFAQLRNIAPRGWAIGVSSLGFMAHHVIVLALFFGWFSFLTWLFSISVAVGGVVWAWLYHRSGSLYIPWLSHLLVDAGIFLIGYDLVRDSIG